MPVGNLYVLSLLVLTLADRDEGIPVVWIGQHIFSEKKCQKLHSALSDYINLSDDDISVNTQQPGTRAEFQVGGESFYHSSGP